MSTDTSVPGPRVSGMDVSDSALLATLLREAPIGFAFFGADRRFRRVNQTLARWRGTDQAEHIGHLPSQVWPGQLAERAESAIRHVLAEDQPLFESDQPITFPVPPPSPDGRALPRLPTPCRQRSGPGAARRQTPHRRASRSGTGPSPGFPRMTRTATSPGSP